MKNISNMDVKGKTILLRVDLNSMVINGKVQETPRIKAHGETIRMLTDREAKVVVLAHQSRPGKDDFIHLGQHAQLLKKWVKIDFVKDICGSKALDAIKNLEVGKALLLDNVRMTKEEFKGTGKTELVRQLSSVTDLYVNDAFSVCHRDHTSIVAFPEVMKSAAGPVLLKELEALKELEKPKKPLIYLLAGSKPEDSLKIVKAKRKNADLFLTAGIIGELFLLAKGYSLGAKEDWLEKRNYMKFLDEFKRLDSDKVIAPLDLAYDKPRQEVKTTQLPTDGIYKDIGQQTAEEYAATIKSAGTVIANGTLGITQEGFTKGSEIVFKALEDSNAFTLVCGGDSSEFLREINLGPGIDHISLAGGAMLAALAEEKLPGVEALEH